MAYINGLDRNQVQMINASLDDFIAQDIVQRKSGFIQIGNNGFTSRLGNRETNNSERKVIELSRVMFS